MGRMAWDTGTLGHWDTGTLGQWDNGMYWAKNARNLFAYHYSGGIFTRTVIFRSKASCSISIV
jgi:hypothetical protein